MQEYRESTSMNSTNGAHEFTEEKLERRVRGLKDRASDCLLEIHATAALLRSATEKIHTLQALRLGHEDPDESELPSEW